MVPQKTNGVLIFFLIATQSLLLALALGVNGLGPLDDHRMAETLFQGKAYGFYIMPELGRFFPLSTQEFVVLSKLFGPSPTLFYAFNAGKLLVIGYLLYQCLATTKLEQGGIAILWCVAIFSCGVANTLFRLSANELNLLILFLIFTWSALFSLRDGQHQSSQTKKNWVLFGLLALTIGLFYKELTFIVCLAFGVAEWGRYARGKHTHPPRFVYVTVLIGAAYLAGYALWRFIYVTGSYANFHAKPIIDVYLEFAYSDPFLIFVAIPVAAYRLPVIVATPSKHSLYDSLLIAACAYMAAYLALRMFNWYYLLPAYAFALTGIAGLVATTKKKWGARLVIFAALLSMLHTLPLSIADIQAQKQIANNHYRFVEALAEWVKANDSSSAAPRTIVLEGVSAGSGVEIIHSLKTFLVFFGVPDNRVRITASEFSDNLSISRFHGMDEQVTLVPSLGNIRVFNPYQQITSVPPLQTPSATQLYRSEIEWALPRWGGEQWIANCVLDWSNCEANVRYDSPYIGYTAFLVIRDGLFMPTTKPLKAPRYGIEIPDPFPLRMPRHSVYFRGVKLENTGAEPWFANGRSSGAGGHVNLAYLWLDQAGNVAMEGNRATLPEPIKPGDKVTVALRVKAPSARGQYRLAVAPVQEGVQWFKPVEEQIVEVY